jgi:DNA polymerase III subunit delta'
VSWQRIRGHEFWVRSFDDAARRGRLAHAYLFAGPAGIGKKFFAFELAKTLLCTGPNEPIATPAQSVLSSPPLQGREDGGEGNESPEGATVNSQGRKPLARDTGKTKPRRGGSGTIAPSGLGSDHDPAIQGLTPLAIDCRPSGPEERRSPSSLVGEGNFSPSPLVGKGGGAFAACDHCPSCLQVAAGTHPDVIFASRPEDRVEFPIDAMREVMAKLALKPARGGYKVAIIDDADDFNHESANCFLKTLEEPPPRSLLILLATDPERQLPTVLSRCQVIRFKPVPVPEVTAFLQEHEIDAARAERLAKISGGSPGQALELAESDLWNFRKEFLAELAKPKPDSVGLAKKWLTFTEQAGTESGMQRRRAALMLRLILEFLEDVLRASTGASLTEVDAEDRPAVEALARRLGTDRVVKLLDRCFDANYHIDRKVQLVLIIESLVDALTNAG